MEHELSFTWLRKAIGRPDLWLSIGLYYGVLYFGYLRPHVIFSPWLSIVGTMAVALAAILDTYSTGLTAKLKPEFDKKGEEFPVIEISPFLPEHPTVRDLLSRKQSAIFLAECLLAFVLPPFGYAQALAHTLQAVRNLRLRQWLLEELRT